MRVPISWLGEWVDLPDDVTLEHLHAALVRVGLEEEDTHTFDLTGPVVVGKVLEFADEPQSNGKTIRWCQVDVGEAEPRGIVCGAHNFEVGDKVVVSLPGAILPGPFPISARKTYGHVSDGMIASARELGLGDEHDGILRLTELGLDPEVGVDAIALLGLDDAAVEVNVTPDRGYAFSIRGIAREYSHSTGAAFRDPADAVEVVDATGYDVTIDDRAPIRGRAGCSVFTARVVRGIDPARPTPLWMASRLRLAGIRSISLPVDITNYTMLELGQPIHGYDLAKLQGGMVIRRAAKGETLETLDGTTRKLDVTDLVVADASGPVGLAGVMGGASTEMSGTTTDVLIEAGVWDPVTIARTVRRHKLPSEAAKRYERGVDPKMSAVAAARVAQLLVDLAGGTLDTLGARYDESVPPAPIELALSLPTALVGVDYTPEQITSTLELIGATVVVKGDVATVTPPTWRPDLTDPPTLVEEIARIIGYHEIPSILPVAPPGRGLTRAQKARRRAAQTLAAAGATEVLSYSVRVGGDRRALRAGRDGDPPRERAGSRTSRCCGARCCPGSSTTARRNLSRGLTDLALFEIGTVFRPEPGVRARHRLHPGRGREARRRDAREARRRHPAPGLARRRAVPRRRVAQAARSERDCRPASPMPSTPCASSRWPSRSTRSSRRGRTPPCTPVARPRSASATASSGTRASCCRRSPPSWTCRALSRWWSWISTRSSSSVRPRSPRRRSGPCPPRRRTCRSSCPSTSRPAMFWTRWSRARASCSSMRGSSTTTGEAACQRAASRSRSRCGSGPRIAR